MLCPHLVDIVFINLVLQCVCVLVSVYNVKYVQSSVFKCMFASVCTMQYKNRAVKVKVYYIT